MKIRRRLLGLFLPALLLCLVDFTVTLAGQSAEYWAGDYEQVNEISPVLNSLLRQHPLAFVAGALVWIGVFGGLMLLLPEFVAAVLCIAVVFGHTAGAATWLLWRFHIGYQLCNALFLLSAVALALGLRYFWRSPSVDAETSPPLLPAVVRWPLVAILAAIGAYLYLIPYLE